MAYIDRQTLYLNNVSAVEIRAPKTGRAYLVVENHDAAKIYMNENHCVDAALAANVATEIQPAGNNFSIREWGQAGDDQGSGVPQGSLWFIGSVAGPQRVTIRQTAR